MIPSLCVRAFMRACLPVRVRMRASFSVSACVMVCVRVFVCMHVCMYVSRYLVWRMRACVRACMWLCLSVSFVAQPTLDLSFAYSIRCPPCVSGILKYVCSTRLKILREQWVFSSRLRDQLLKICTLVLMRVKYFHVKEAHTFKVACRLDFVSKN